jgi:tight adherence protein C
VSVAWSSRPGLRVLAAPARRRARAVDRAAISQDVPILVDLVAVALGAGTTPHLACARVARWAPTSLASHCESVAAASARGQRFVDACAQVAGREPALAPLLELLAAGAVDGGALAPSLARLAATARDDARRRAEARARTVPVRLLFPLVLTVLPAFVLLTVVPVVLGVLSGR